MIFGDLGSLMLPDICPKDEEKPQKNLTQECCPDQGLNPGPLHDRYTCYRLLHSSGREIKCMYLENYKFLNLSKKLSYQ